MPKCVPAFFVVTSSFFSGPFAIAAEVPIWGAYGTLSSCVLWTNGSERQMAGYDGDFTLLTRPLLEGLEWGCEFGAVTAVGQSVWQVEGTCASAGEHEDGSPIPTSKLTIEEATDRTKVTVAGLDFFRESLVLPSCNLPYEEQLRLELNRLADEGRE